MIANDENPLTYIYWFFSLRPPCPTSSGVLSKPQPYCLSGLPKEAIEGDSPPAQGELPIVVLRVHVVDCSNLTSKDKNGFSDPLVSSFLPSNSLTQFFPGLLSSPFSIPVNKHLSPNAPSTLSTLRKMLRLIFPFIFQLLTSLVPWNSSFGTKTYFRRIT